MSDVNNLIQNESNVNNKIEYDENLKKIAKEVVKKFDDYSNSMKFMAADAPIAVLCLPYSVQKILIANNLLRVYDLFNRDFTKIEGLNASGASRLTSSFDQFLSML